MKLDVKSVKGDKFSVEVENTDSVEIIKTKINEIMKDWTPDRQKLILAGKVLKDDQKVEGLELKENSFVVCMVGKLKNPAPTPAAAPAPTAAPAPASVAAPTVAPTTPAPTSGTTTTPGAPVQAPAAAPPTTPAAPSPAVNYATPENIAMLTAMGFAETDVTAALNMTQGNPNLAAEILMDPAAMQAAMAAGAPSPAAAAPPAAPPASTGGSSGGITLESLRSHPQFSQLQGLIQSNPASVNQVLDLIGQQNPALLEVIHADQDAFMAMMNEPPAAPGTAPAVPAPAGGPVMAANDPLLGGMGGMGMGGGAPNPQELIAALGAINSLPPEQRDQALQSMGIDANQMQQMQQVLSQVPPEQLAQIMAGAMGGGMGGGMGEGGGQQPGVIHLAPEEMAAVQRLQELGFTQQQAAEAYLACDKNEEQAANLLFNSFGDDQNPFHSNQIKCNQMKLKLEVFPDSNK